MNKTVDAALAQWADAFARLDYAKLSSLYTDDAMFFGSTPQLRRGPQGVRDYFASLPPMPGASVEFNDIETAPAGPDVINVAMVAAFALPERPPVLMRLTHTLVRTSDGWRIASHHASPKN